MLLRKKVLTCLFIPIDFELAHVPERSFVSTSARVGAKLRCRIELVVTSAVPAVGTSCLVRNVIARNVCWKS